MIRISTKLDRATVVSALGELAPSTYNPRIFRSTFEGKIDSQIVEIGYRFGWHVPPFRLVSFAGRIASSGENTEIKGTVGSGWMVYVYGAAFLLIFLFSLYEYVSAGDASNVFWSLLPITAVLFLGFALVRSTQNYVVDEIARAIRGKVSRD